MELLSHDILMIGGGLAGLRAAIEAKKAGRMWPSSPRFILSDLTLWLLKEESMPPWEMHLPLLKIRGKIMLLIRSKEATIWRIRMPWR